MTDEIEMIDTKELRRLAQAATHPTTKGRWMRLFGERTVYDRMEDGCRGIPIVATDYHPPGPQEAAYLDFIAAANPATISELLDRLEAAEKERDELRSLVVMRFDHDHPPQFTQGYEPHELNEPVTAEHCRWFVAEIERLRAKIEHMENQEPVGRFARIDGDGPLMECKHADIPRVPLYALPGAKGEEK